MDSHFRGNDNPVFLTFESASFLYTKFIKQLFYLRNFSTADAQFSPSIAAETIPPA